MEPEAFIKFQVADLCGLSVDDLTDDGKLIGFGIDSVRLVDLMISIEEHFNIEINEMDPALADVKTVGQLVDYVKSRVGR